MTDPFAQFKAAQRAAWASFAPLETFTTMPAANLVQFARVSPGMRALDVACGTGVVAVTLARTGVEVTGLDLTPELLEVARRNTRLAGAEIDFHEGDVEALPFPDGSFDAVLSQYGHMFAPRPEVAVSEMLRVLKPGGVLAFSTWPPEMYIGQLFTLTAKYAPPPAGVASPLLWGDPTVVEQRLGEKIRNLTFDRGVAFKAAMSPAHERAFTESTAGPIKRFVDSAQGTPALERFRREFENVVSLFFEGNRVRHDFLLTRAIKA